MIKDERGRGLTDLRISLTDRCNLRCTYCMPKEIFGPDYVFLKKNEWLHFSELDALVEAFVRLGVKKIRLTGGEPLLRPGLVKYIAGLKRFEAIEDIALTTNGLRLAEKVGELKEAGLSRVTISLDALDDKICGQMNGMGIGSKVVLAGIEAALNAGLSVKVNTVIERGVNESEILPLLRHFRGKDVVVRFIEFMDVGNHNGWKTERVVSGREIVSIVESEFAIEPLDLTSINEVAKRYAFKDGIGEFGVITSVSQPFCSGCTRARISADGKLYTCLFASEGLDLKTIMRAPDFSKEALFELLSKHWTKRNDRYSEIRSEIAQKERKKVEMSYIGG